MQRRIARRLRVIVSLTTLAVAGPLAGTASADAFRYATRGSYVFTVPAGVTTVQVTAVGGHGGLDGGFGAVVSGDLAVTPGSSLAVEVAGNGLSGAAGFGGGGGVPFDSFAGGGGGASRVALGGQPLLVAGGGGGGGDDSLSFGGTGGDAGADGSAGDADVVGPAVAAVAGGGGGTAGSLVAAGAPGVAGPSPDGTCVAGAAGSADAAAGQGGTGAPSADPFDFGDGGGGGGGLYGGGGGGSGGYCATEDEGLGGGGGGGGSSLVPAGGNVATDGSGTPTVTFTWTDPPRPRTVIPLPAPSVTISVPADGATYAQGQVVRASFGCSARFGNSVGECTGTAAANGGAIDTATLGAHTFTVIGVSRTGARAEKTVRYTVADRRAPRFSGLTLGSSTIDLGARRAWTRVGFRLSERGPVTIRIARVRSSRAARVQRIAGKQGRNNFRLRARVGRRTLRPGTYRLTLVATDAAGNRSAVVRRRFTVVA